MVQLLRITPSANAGTVLNVTDSTNSQNYLTVRGDGDVRLNGGNVGIGTTEPNNALDVVGDIDATGCVQTDDTGSIGGTCVPDMRLKKNIQNLSNSLEKITRLNPVTFEWREEYYNISHENGTGIGLIALRTFARLSTTCFYSNITAES